MIVIPSWLVGYIPAIAGTIFAFLAWQAALYTKRHAHDPRES